MTGQSNQSNKLATDSAPRRNMPAAEARERLLEAATTLFLEQGIHAVGIDAVVKQAGVNKMSLYRQFASKDDLVIAYLGRMEARYWRRFEQSLAHHPGNPMRQLMQLIDDIHERVSSPTFKGCPFIKAIFETADRTSAIRIVAERQKTDVAARLRRLAQRAALKNPMELTDCLMVLIEGMYSASQTACSRNVLEAAHLLARELIERAIPVVAAT